MRIALVQMTATPDPAANRRTVAHLLEGGGGWGADVVVLPELWHVSGPAAALRAAAEPLDGPTVAWLGEQARAAGAWLVGGTVVEGGGGADAAGAGGRPSNTCVVLDPAGDLVAAYRKIHLFDCEVPGARFEESDTFLPGDRPVVVDIAGVRCGLAVCFDLRFPDLMTGLAADGASVLIVPSAFTARTGRDHWELLVRARAIDTQAFVVATDQCGATPGGLAWHGHSMAVDPWGRVLVDAGEDEGVVVVDLDLDEVERVRGLLPVLARATPGRAWTPS